MEKRIRETRDETFLSAREEWRGELEGKKVEAPVRVLTRPMSRKEKEEDEEALADVGDLLPCEEGAAKGSTAWIPMEKRRRAARQEVLTIWRG